MPENWKEKLSILTCRYLFGGFEGSRRFESDGFSKKVYLFQADYTLGFTTDWKHILLNKRLFEEDLENVQRQIFLHEKGHEESSILHLTAGWLPLLTFYVAVPLIVSLTILTLISELLFNSPLFGLTSAEIWKFFYALVLLVPISIITSYIIETKADLFSLKYMDSADFREAKESFKEIQPITPFRLLLIRLTHPSADFVLDFQRLLDKLRDVRGSNQVNTELKSKNE